MADSPKAGDQVEWNTPQGKTEGKVVKKLTSPTDVKGHHVVASPENPELLVESSRTGQQAAHKPQALKKTRKKKGKS